MNMKVIKLKKRELDIKDYIKRSAKESDCSLLITEPTTLIDGDTGEIKVVYDLLGLNTDMVVEALKKIKYTKGKRSRGLVSTSRILGFRPRNEMRQDYCSSVSLAIESPREHDLVTGLALQLESVYQKYNAEGYKKHKALTDEKVQKEWRIGNSSVFTSGIINKNNPLKYHFDTGNFTDVYSMMVVFKGGVEGGYLALPEYDCMFALPHNSLFMFDGQGILHGVTPIKYTSPVGYRFSVVYYTLKRMWQCLEINQEIARIREKKTVRERTRLNTSLTESDRLLKEKNETMLKNRMGKQ